MQKSGIAGVKKGKKGRSRFTSKELEILKLVQEGKTNEEIASVTGKSKWTAKYHLKNIFEKLGAKTRAQALSKAIGQGILAPALDESVPIGGKNLKIGIIGCGKGGKAILELFKDNTMVTVKWVVDKDESAVAIPLARKLNIPIGRSFEEFLNETDKVDVIINLTGSPKISEELRRRVPTDTELMSGVSARIMWDLFEERRQRVEERERVLKEHETLYHLGLVIESIDSLKDAGYALVDYATKLTGAPAGSLAMFDEKKEDMFLVASKGFSSGFRKRDRWDIRQGGLTSKILNHDGPLLIEDLREIESPNPSLIKEGVRALLAAPIMVEGRIVGILYVNDFKRRGFRAEDVSLFSLLTIYAGLTLERVKSIEATRLLSITDGLTGLYNQRYLMEQLQREVERAARHSHNISVVLFDIDNFKSYNDTYGHLEGNKVLKVIGKLVKKCSRGTDTVSRFGGEEFCVIMPHINARGAQIFAKRLLDAVANYKMPNRQITVSGGVAIFPSDGKSHTSLLNKADKRLYAAKKAGKNRFCCT